MLLLLLASGSACRRDGEVLAEWNGGNMTRREMRLLFQMFQGQDAAGAATVEAQDQTVRTYSLMKIAAEEAVKEGLDKDAAFLERMRLIDEQALLTAFENYLRANVSSQKYRMFDLQFLILSSPDPKSLSQRKPEAEDLLNKLNAPNLSDTDIESIIQTKTENMLYRPLAGYLDPHCVSCTPNPLNYLTDPLDKVPVKKFILVETPTGLWLIRKVKEYEAGQDDLQDIFETFHKTSQRLVRKFMSGPDAAGQNKQFYDRVVKSEQQIEEYAKEEAKEQIRRQSGTLFQSRLDSLRQKYKFVLEERGKPVEKLNQADYRDDTVLFTLDGKPYTYKTLREKAPPGAGIDQQIQLLNGVLIPFELIKNEEDVVKARESDIFSFFKELNRYESLARVYFFKHQGDVTVPEEKIRQIYELRKNNEYSGQAYAAVRNGIMEQLRTEELQKRAQDMQSKLMEKYAVQIHRDLLKPGSL